jgi:hypothetical protein
MTSDATNVKSVVVKMTRDVGRPLPGDPSYTFRAGETYLVDHETVEALGLLKPSGDLPPAATEVARNSIASGTDTNAGEEKAAKPKKGAVAAAVSEPTGTG